MIGQLGIQTLIMALVVIVLFVAVIAPVCMEFIDNFVENESTSPMTNTIVLLFMPMLAIGIVAGIVFYFMPQREVSQGG